MLLVYCLVEKSVVELAELLVALKADLREYWMAAELVVLSAHRRVDKREFHWAGMKV